MNPPLKSSLNPSTIILLCLAAAVFVFTRFAYWTFTFEFPFSDMADFERVAGHILAEFSFRMDDFWLSYKPPVLPALRAIQVLLSGTDFLNWRIFLITLTFTSLLWMLYEIYRISRHNCLVVVLLFTVAISKSSVFWSYKLATEGVTEGLTYLSIAMAMFAWRRPGISFFFLASLLTISVLNRPNSIFALLVFPLLYAGNVFYARQDRPFLHLLKLGLLYGFAVVLLWGPWMYRSYRIYGHVVPLNTSGPASFIYGVWNIDIKQPDGSRTTKNWQEIMAMGTEKFANDYEFYKWSGQLVSDWLNENWQKMPGLVVTRLEQGIRDRDVQLTQVSRFKLLPNSANELLIDKNFIAIILGVIGLCLLPFVVDLRLAFIPLFAVPTWLISLIFQGNPRFIEPVMPLFLFGNFTWLLIVWKLLPEGLKAIINARTARSTAATALVSSCFALFYFSTVFSASPPEADQNRLAIENGGMEDFGVHLNELAAPGWKFGGQGTGELTADTEHVHGGARSARIEIGSGSRALYQDIKYTTEIADLEFEIHAFVLADRADAAYLALADGVKWFYSTRNKTAGGWEELIVKGRISDEPKSLRLHLYVDKGTVAFDDVLLSVTN